jgi:Nucleotide-diphospho-sugar transferase
MFQRQGTSTILLIVVLVFASTTVATLFALLFYEYLPIPSQLRFHSSSSEEDHIIDRLGRFVGHNKTTQYTSLKADFSPSSTADSFKLSIPTVETRLSTSSSTAGSGIQSKPTEPPSSPSYIAEGIPVPYPNRDGIESDDEISYLRYLISGMALNNTIIIVPTNLAFARIAINLDCRMRALGITNALFWALDEWTVDVLQAYSIPVYFNPSFYSHANAERYHSESYNKMMQDRPKLWRMVLRTGHNMLFLDADIALLTDPMAELVQDADLEGQVDEGDFFRATNEYTNPQLCGGAFFLKSNERSIQFLDQVETAIRESWWGLVEDQQAINTIIHDPSYARMLNRFEIDPNGERTPFGGHQNGSDDDRLSVRFVPAQGYLNGHLWRGYAGGGGGRRIEFKDEGAIFEEFEPALVHLNGIVEKEALLKTSGWWNLQDDMSCLLGNETAM